MKTFNITKKLWSVVGLTVLLAVGSAQAQSLSITKTLAAGVITNMVGTLPSGSAVVTSWLLTAPAGVHGSISAYDSITNALTYTNSSYSVLSQFATNVITSYTNYWGVQNNFTNIALLTVTNTVAASTNFYPVRFVATTPTNASTLFANGSTVFNNGVWVTNTGPGAVTLTVTYRK